MTAPGFTLFDTEIGHCGIAWGERGVTGVQLPESSEARTRARLLQRCPDACELPPAPEVQRVIDGIVALLRGERVDLSEVPLDMDRVDEFERRVYDIARTIAAGATLTYGEIAGRLGDRGLARAVGQALGRNPFPIIVPCHRVLAAGGKAGGFSANGGLTTKLRLLSIERARTSDAPTLFDGDGAFGFALEPGRRNSR
jgi:methylated-DNA-[protein]-cysteine S-methyltransferase